ncbi:hypothetical protein ACFL3I_08795 [Pseudomonadota bacterium]
MIEIKMPQMYDITTRFFQLPQGELSWAERIRPDDFARYWHHSNLITAIASTVTLLTP